MQQAKITEQNTSDAFGLTAPIWQIGGDPHDSNEVQLQKRLLVISTVMMASLGVLWGLIYYAHEEYVAASIPLSYSVASFASLGLFAKIRRYTLFRFSQLLFSLLLPFFLMLALGGFVHSSGVVMWSLTSPLGALVFAGRRQALGWFLAYLGLVGLGAVVSPVHANNLSPVLITLFFVMNIGCVSIVAYVLLQAFAGEQDLALVMLDRKQQWIHDAFSSYVSPNLVQHLLDHPDLLQLGGELRECSFVLTDMAGFTSLVEQTEPVKVVTLLNAYLEAMTRIALKHHGTIDKIVGDAVAVMFSAPIPQPDHAQRAVACALEIDAFAVNFAAEQRRNGMALGDTRIGVNTGEVIVGNVGSRSHFDYRALGDAINTASRLESANRYLGTRICVGEATVAQCPDFVGRPIGTLLLKGKDIGVKTFEAWPEEGRESPLLIQYAAAFQALDADESDAATAFEVLGGEYPNDPLVKFYLDRLDQESSSTVIAFDDK